MEVKEKKIFNLDSHEPYTNAKVAFGNPNGIINFERNNHKWAFGLYKKMCERTWFPGHVNISKDKVDYPVLGEAQKRAYDLVLAQLITNDSIQANQLADKINSFITSPVVNAAVIRQSWEECYVEGTEVLTTNGFKDFKDLTMNDMVATYNKNGEIVFSNPTSITKRPHHGAVYEFEQDNYTQIVTPGHRVVKLKPYINHKRKGVEIELAEDCDFEGYNAPIAGRHILGSKKTFTPMDAIRTIYSVTGKSVKPINANTQYCYEFKITDDDKIDRFQYYINLLDFKFERLDVNSYSLFYVYTDEKLDKNLDWVQLIRCHSIWYTSLIQELKYWSCSSCRDTDSIIIDTSNKKLIDKLQAICAISGSGSHLYIDVLDKGMEYSQFVYSLKIIIGKDYKKGNKMSKSKWRYYGMVYCCTVDTGILVCRYDNKVFISGNCNHSHSYSIMAEEICKETDKIFDMHNQDEELMLKNRAVQDMYLSLYKEDNEYEPEDLLLAIVANQILESLVFPGGFAIMLSYGELMRGSQEMIKEINI